MTRAEAEAAVIAAAREMLTRYERSPGSFWKEAPGLRDAFAALDALPPDDTDVEIEMRMTEPQMAQLVETFSRWVQAVTPLALVAKLDTIDALGVPVPREVHEARALAWESGDLVRLLRNAHREEWNIAFEAGWWLTRDAEHAQHAGTYRVDAERGGGQTECRRDAVRTGAEVPATPAPSGSEGMAGGDMAALTARLDALAAQVGRIERAVREVATRLEVLNPDDEIDVAESARRLRDAADEALLAFQTAATRRAEGA